VDAGNDRIQVFRRSKPAVEAESFGKIKALFN
jgi:hypothetical protein